MSQQRQKRLRPTYEDGYGDSPVAKKSVNENSGTDTNWELSIPEPMLSEQSTSFSSMQDESSVVRFSIDLFISKPRVSSFSFSIG